MCSCDQVIEGERDRVWVVALGREGGEDVQKVGESEPAGVGRGLAVRRRPVPPQVTLASRAHHCPRRPGNSSSLSVTRLLLLLVVIFQMLMVLCALQGVILLIAYFNSGSGRLKILG